MNTTYHKIETLFERDPETFVVNPYLIKKPVLETISKWETTEKVDGMNIRVVYNPFALQFLGRSDAAKLPEDLLKHLNDSFHPDKLRGLFDGPVVLYGEGYGAGIQKGGGNYRKDKGFVLFDVLHINPSLKYGGWWENDDGMRTIAGTLGIPAVPNIGCFNLSTIVDLCRLGFESQMPGHTPGFRAEGIVARPVETLFDSFGNRVIIKLKTKDFMPSRAPMQRTGRCSHE